MEDKLIEISRSLKEKFEENSRILEEQLKYHISEKIGNLEDDLNKIK